MPLAADCFMIIVALGRGQPLETFGDSLETGRLGSEIGPPRICAAHDGCHAIDRLVLYIVLLYDPSSAPEVSYGMAPVLRTTLST